MSEKPVISTTESRKTTTEIPDDSVNDIWHNITKFLDHERGKILGALLGIALAFIPLACESTTTLYDGQVVTRPQLEQIAITERQQIEYDMAVLEGRIAAYNEMLEVAEADLDAKDAKKQELLNFVGGTLGQVASGQAINPLALATTALTTGLFGLFGGHSLVDSRRKNKRIELLKKA